MSESEPPRLPAFTYSAPEELQVFAFVPGKFPEDSLSDEGKYEELGGTRGWFGRRRAVAVPEHITWGVSGAFEDVLAAAKRDKVPGLDLTHNTKLTDADLARVAELEWLRDLTLPPWSAITDKGLESLAKV